MKQRVLILGASGLVGQSLWRRLEKEEGIDLFGTYRRSRPPAAQPERLRPFNLETDEVETLLDEVRPQVIVSSLRGDFAAQTALHRRAARWLLEQREGRLVFLSTANVFDGDLSRPHNEKDAPQPASEYGLFKAACEEMLLTKLGGRCCVVRLPMIFGENCRRLRELRGPGPVPTVSNYYVNIASDTQAAEYLAQLIQSGAGGVFHAGTADVMDYLELQRRVCALVNIPEPAFEEQAGRRPRYLALFSCVQGPSAFPPTHIAPTLAALYASREEAP